MRQLGQPGNGSGIINGVLSAIAKGVDHLSRGSKLKPEIHKAGCQKLIILQHNRDYNRILFDYYSSHHSQLKDNEK